MKLIKISVYLVLSLFLLTWNISAKDAEGTKGKVLKTTGTPAATKFNINNISTFFSNDGQSDLSNTGDSGFQFPIGSGHTVFYESGFLYGGYVNNEWRVSGSTYNRGQVPGRILPGAVREDPALPAVRIYRVRRDYKDPNADYSKEISDEGATKAAIYAQYDTDWQQWPAQYGAPYEDKNNNGVYDPTVDIPGVPGSDQTIWFVCNDLDPVQAQKLYGSVGLGLEMQATIWGYNQQTALGDALFRKYTLINKGGNKVDSMYVCMWSDPDLGGDAGDDFAGCDTLLSLGFIYNADDTDPSYGQYIPASGFDFLQGPIIKGTTSDKAIFKNKIRTGYKNMPMTAFFMFTQGVANWGDPGLGNYTTGALRVRNLFQGKIGSLGTPFTDPLTGRTTKFCVPGDPVTGKGWVDGILFPKQDRRIGTVSGPFTLAAGDTQEVVVGQLAAGGVAPVTRLGAVAKLKFQDRQVQTAYDNFFVVPPSPQAPIVSLDPVTKLGTASEFDKKLIISWGDDANAVKATESYNTQGYKFEGYVVYQLPSLTAQLSEGKVVATLDLVTDPGIIISASFDANTNQETKSVNKSGSNSGVARYITIDKDYLRGGIPLANGTTYYYVVSSYVFNSNPDIVPNVLETLSSRIVATPHAPNPGVAFTTSAGTAVATAHSQGTSDGKATVSVIDPAKVTGHSYEISFAGTVGNTKWTLVNKTTGATKLSGISEGLGSGAPLVDGLQIDVTGAPNDIKNILVTANGNGVLATPEMGCFAFNNSGFPLSPSGADRPGANQQKNGNNVWGIHTAEVANAENALFTFFKFRVTQSNARWPLIIPNDFEIRFTAAGGKALIYPGAGYGGTGKLINVPFELWNVGTKADASDDVRYFPYILDESNANAGNGKFDLSGVDHTISGGTNDPQTDWFYWCIPQNQAPGQAGYNAIVADGDAHVYLNTTTTAGTDAFRRFVFVGWNLSDITALANIPAGKELPETGTVFKIITTKPNVPTSGTTGDKFTFTAPSVITGNTDLAMQEVDKINVFPNPYYGVNPREVNKYQRYVTFSHLPQKATLRVFNLAGQLVRVLQKDSPSQFTTWDLLNDSSFPVASGLYIVHIDMPDLGTTKVIKLAVIQEQQLLDHF